jgi:hypothetical protein
MDHYYIFDLEQLTVRIHAYFKLGPGYTPQVDCFNNIIMVKHNEFHKIIDIDNVFRQKLKQQTSLHTIRFEIKDDCIVRNFYKTLMNVDNIFKRYKVEKEKEGDLSRRSISRRLTSLTSRILESETNANRV